MTNLELIECVQLVKIPFSELLTAHLALERQHVGTQREPGLPGARLALPASCMQPQIFYILCQFGMSPSNRPQHFLPFLLRVIHCRPYGCWYHSRTRHRRGHCSTQTVRILRSARSVRDIGVTSGSSRRGVPARAPYWGLETRQSPL